MIRRSITAVTLIVVMAVPATAWAQADTPSADEELRERIELLCARVPKVQERVQLAIDTITGDADTVGSNAWLEETAAIADEAGRTNLAENLRSRIEIRNQRLDVLELRLERLANFQARCEAAAA
jgi:hypothetical protein